jgi:hypothetical protein
VWNDINYEECCLLGCDAVSFIGTNISEEHIASVIRVEIIRELETT